jgi:hypothetical protein
VTFDARAFFERFMDALNVHDMDTIRDMTHPDFTTDSPQSGERAHGWVAWEVQLREYPGVDKIVPQLTDAQIIGDEERWALSPAYTVVPLASPNEFTTIMRSQYPDGSWWRIVTFVQLRDQKLYRLEVYYAPELSAPLPESIAAYAHG